MVGHVWYPLNTCCLSVSAPPRVHPACVSAFVVMNSPTPAVKEVISEDKKNSSVLDEILLNKVVYSLVVYHMSRHHHFVILLFLCCCLGSVCPLICFPVPHCSEPLLEYIKG